MDLSLHLSDDQLELYALDRLAEPEEDRIESHLLLCDPCRHRLDEVGAFAFAMTSALRKNPPYLDAVEPKFPWSLFAWRSWMLPGMAVAGAAAVLVVMLFVRQSDNRSLVPVATLALAATRGDAITAPQAREYDLLLSGSLPANAVVKVYSGRDEMWKGQPVESPGGAQAKVDRALTPGAYIVRLEDAAGNTIREYGFEVRK